MFRIVPFVVVRANKHLLLLFLLVLMEPGHHLRGKYDGVETQGQGVEGKSSPVTGMEGSP